MQQVRTIFKRDKEEMSLLASINNALLGLAMERDSTAIILGKDVAFGEAFSGFTG